MMNYTEYHAAFPETEVNQTTYNRLLAEGRRVCSETGALFIPWYDDETVAQDIVEEWEMPMKPEARGLERTVAVGELIEANINFTIVSEDIGFVKEAVEWHCHLRGVVVVSNIPKDLRGIGEVERKTGAILEPMTVEETLRFISYAKNPKRLEEPEKEISVGKAYIEKALLQEQLELAAELYETMSQKHKGFLAQRMDSDIEGRVNASITRQNIGETWSHSSRWGIGHREGTILDQGASADQQWSKSAQWQQPEETCDGQLMFSQELEKARVHNAFTEMYDITKRGPDGEAANKGSSEYGLYLRRCSEERVARYAEILWTILTANLEEVPSIMQGVRNAYKASIRENSPGPKSEMIAGRWVKVPLKGAEAKKALNIHGLGTLRGCRANKDMKYSKGESWHKNFLNREHMDELEKTFNRRMGKVKLVIGEETIEETIPTYEGHAKRTA